MERMIGRTKSWVWWLGGVLCAVVFGGIADADAAVARKPKYGVKPRPRPNARPSAKPEDIKKADKVVETYLAPVAATEPAAEQKARIDKLIKDFASEASATRAAASKAVIEFGAAALGALRGATDSPDAEVATRAQDAITRIERAVRDKLVVELKKNINAAVAAISVRQSKVNLTYRAALKAETAARKAGDEKAREAARTRRVAASKLNAKLLGLRNRVSPVKSMPAPVYGVRVMKAQ